MQVTDEMVERALAACEPSRDDPDATRSKYMRLALEAALAYAPMPDPDERFKQLAALLQNSRLALESAVLAEAPAPTSPLLEEQYRREINYYATRASEMEARAVGAEVRVKELEAALSSKLLTAEERTTVEKLRGCYGHIEEVLVAIIDRLAPRPEGNEP